jgi:hypothetical protein
MSNFVGGLAGAGVSYAMTGEVALNVLNLSDLTGGKLSSGLLELRLGKNGTSMNIGTGGTDVSFGTVSAAFAGLKDSGKVIGAKLSAVAGKQESVSTLNAVNMLGWTGGEYEQGLAKAVWEDKLKVNYADMDGAYGEYRVGSDGITISRAMLGGGKEGSAKLATVMSHEGTHAGGNRIEALAHLQGNSTYNTINAMFGLRGDAGFSGQMISAINDTGSWVKNTGDVDRWEVKKDGSIFDDGKDGVISFEDGREAVHTASKGKQSSLEEFLGLEKGTGYSLLQMGKAGFVYDPATKTWTGSGGTISADVVKGLIAQGLVAADAVAGLAAEPPAATGTAGVTPEPEQGFWQGLLAGAGDLWDGAKTVGAGLWDGIKAGLTGLASLVGIGGKKKEAQAPVVEAAIDLNEPQDYDYMATKEQWDKVTSPEFYGKYEAQIKTETDNPLDQLKGLSTQCNTFLDAVVKGFGDQAYKDIMPNGSESPDALFQTWEANPNLIKLGGEDDAWVLAQMYADQGHIVLSAASDNGNHVAFVLPRGYEYATLPKTDWKQRGYTVPQGPINYSGTIGQDWPAFLQSGSYTGIVSPPWAYSSNMIRNKEVHFYVYTGGKK